MSELCDLSALELRRRIGTKEISPVELLQSCIKRIEAVDGQFRGIEVVAGKGIVFVGIAAAATAGHQKN